MSLSLSTDKALPGFTKVTRGSGRVHSAACTGSEGFSQALSGEAPMVTNKRGVMVRPLVLPKHKVKKFDKQSHLFSLSTTIKGDRSWESDFTILTLFPELI